MRVVRTHTGALLVFFEVAAEALGSKIRTMVDGPIQAISGPFAEEIKWHMVAEALPAFKGVDFWNLKVCLILVQLELAWDWGGCKAIDCGQLNQRWPGRLCACGRSVLLAK